MAEARQRGDWGRAAAVMALIANCHRDPKKARPFRPADFDPYAGPREAAGAGGAVEVDKDNIGMLKAAFFSDKAEKPRKGSQP